MNNKVHNINNEDVERIIKLVNEYSFRLKELINIYQEQRKNKVNILFALTIILSVVAVIIFIYFQLNISFEQKLDTYVLVVISSIAILTFIYSFIFNQKNRRNSTDILDEAFLIKKQLSQLILIASQTREHLVDFESLALLEIDLKLTEAEDIIERANRIFYFKSREKY